eukprot:scaffold167857_cov19-Tisochrysis_lutea.AAC.2
MGSAGQLGRGPAGCGGRASQLRVKRSEKNAGAVQAKCTKALQAARAGRLRFAAHKPAGALHFCCTVSR